jgi:hypothetical protein
MNNMNNKIYKSYNNLALKQTPTRPDTFFGCATMYGADHQGDCIQPNAFTKSLQYKMPSMLWAHKIEYPVGQWLVVQESDNGLYVEGQLLLDLPKAAELYPLMLTNQINELSIGFYIVQSTTKQGIRYISELLLDEISIVPNGVRPGAEIQGFKS